MELETVFLEAIEFHTPDTWERFLSVRCDGDDALRAQVTRLLRGHASASGFMDQPAPIVLSLDLGGQSESRVDAIPGTCIGSYLLIESLGEGGMGTVYLAEQRHPIRRMVALKVIKPGMDTRDIVRRFEAERQTLALMNHPGVAQVLDAGTTDSSRPYFVMELVRGEPITRFCDSLHMNIPDRLKLMISVCEAVQHAHQKGIVHRDLKPTNVLVMMQDARPVPKIIDFGIAKVIGQSSPDVSMHTGFHQVIGTPGYMSPEQFSMNRQDTDIRSDVYSLGILLYELLTGTTPLTRETVLNKSHEEISRIVREVEPPRPGLRLAQLSVADSEAIANNRASDAGRLVKTLRGELDWIVMKSLEKEQSRRYETVAAFAADLQRYLDHEPVSASPPSKRYRLFKAWQKYRLIITAVVALTMTLSLGLAFSIWQAIVARRAVEQSSDYLIIAQEKQSQFQDLAWRAGIRDAYAAWERFQCFETDRALQKLRQTDPSATSRLEWQLLNEGKNQVYRRVLKTDAPLHEVRLIPNSRRLVVVGEDGCIRIVEAATGKVVQRIQTPVPQLHALAVSADGKMVAAGGTVDPATDRSVPLVYDLSTGKCLHQLRGQLTTIESLEFSGDGKFLACGCRYENVQVFELSTHSAKELAAARRNTWLASDPAGRFIFSEESPSSVRISEFVTSDPGQSTLVDLRILTGLMHPQNHLFHVLAQGEDCSTLVRFIETAQGFEGRNICEFIGSHGFARFAINDQATAIAVGLEHGDVIFYPMPTPEESSTAVSATSEAVRRFEASFRWHVSEHPITSLCFDHDWLFVTTFAGELLALRLDFPELYIGYRTHPPQSPEPTGEHSTLHVSEQPTVTAYTIDVTGGIVLMGLANGAVVRANLPDGTDSLSTVTKSRQFPVPSELLPSSLAWQTAEVQEKPEYSHEVTALAISRTGKQIAVVRNEREILIIEDGAVRVIQSLTSEMKQGLIEIETLDAVALSADGQWLSWTGDRFVSFVRITDPELRIQQVQLPGLGRCVAWSNDASEIAVGGNFRAIALVSVTEQTLRLEKTSGSEVYGIHYTAKGHQLLTGHSDGSVQQWDFRTGQHRSLHAHRSAVVGVEVDSDGQIGIAVDQNANMTVFSLESNERLGFLRTTQDRIPRDSNLLSPQLVLSQKDGRLRLISHDASSTLKLTTWPVH